MKQLVLLIIFLVLLFAGGLAVALFHWWGWKGLVAFPVLLFVLIWIGQGFVRVMYREAERRMHASKAAALKGATMTLESVSLVSEMPGDDRPGQDEDDTEEAEEDEDTEPCEYCSAYLTITPADKAKASEWAPEELVLTSERVRSIDEVKAKQIGFVDEVLVWDGMEFVGDDEREYSGAQRLLLSFAVQPGAPRRTYVYYHGESIGALDLPPGGTVEAD